MDVVTLALAKKHTNTRLLTKADLVGGKVPSSQLPSYVSTIVEVETYTDLPAVGSGSTIYVVKDENNQQYRWGGTAYIPVGDEKVYYAVTVVTMTTMGELKAYVDGINSQQLHILLDMHNYVTDAYVCTAHFYEVGGVKHCEIFDLLNSQYIGNPAGFVDSDTIASYCAYKFDVETKPTTVKNTSDATITVAAQKNTNYIYGELTTLNVTWGTGEDNAEINITFKSGATPTTLSVSTTGAKVEAYIPKPNSEVTIHAVWYIDKWIVSFKDELPKSGTLLWTNPSIGSSFTPTKIEIDLSAYSFVMITTLARGTPSIIDKKVEGYSNTIVPVEDTPSAKTVAINYVAPNGSASHYICTRGFSAEKTGVNVYDAYYTNGSPDNGMCRPYKIYGIR